MDDEGRSSLGFEEGVVATASYFVGVGLLLLLLEKRSNFVRFHALQSTLGYGVLLVLHLCVKWIDALSYMFWAPGLMALFFALFMMYHAYHGEEYRFPVIGNLAFSAVFDTEPENEDPPPTDNPKPDNAA